METFINTKLISRGRVAENTYEITLRTPKEFSFKPGQYIWVILPKLNRLGVGEDRRAFSICSSPGDTGKVSFSFRASNSKFKKALLALPKNSEIKISEPRGYLTLPEDTSVPVVFVAGGIGISPFLSMIRLTLEQKSKRQITLFYANQNKKNAAYIDELEKIEKQNLNFILHSTYGPITEKFIRSESHANSKGVWYIIGPQQMVNDVYLFIRKLKVPDSRLHFEEFYPLYNKEEQLLSKLARENIETFLKLVIEKSSNHIVITDINGIIEYVNPAAEQTTGYSIKEMLGQTPRLWGGLMGEKFYENLWQTIKYQKKSFVGEIKNRRKNGSDYTALARISPLLDKQKKLIGFMATEEDISEMVRISQSKSEFISLASHQFRTPLSIINWYSELLLGGDSGPINTDQRKYLEEIHAGSQRMVALVNNLLNVSRIEMGTTFIETEEFSVSALAHSVISELVPQIKEKNLQIKETYDKNIPNFNIDPKLIRIIIQNLASNAVKYTPEKGKVEVRAELQKNDVLLTVSDNGYGIPKDDANKIFGKFFRAVNVRKMPDGTGLGLYIVKQAVDQIKGKIWFESEEGHGTTFYVKIPLKSVVLPKKHGLPKITEVKGHDLL